MEIDAKVLSVNCDEVLYNSQNMVLQAFTQKLNREPNPAEFDKTADGKAYTLPISFVEMTLDEIYFGMWELTDPSYQQIFNEVVGTATLTVKHPITGDKIRRVGFASIIITQDSGANLADFNSTKKKNALDLSFPKLKAEILKNAAQSLGKIFGRDINRKKKDTFTPSLVPISNEAFEAAKQRIREGKIGTIELVASSFIVTDEQMNELREIKPLKQLS
jgi:hypothetical protein